VVGFINLTPHKVTVYDSKGEKIIAEIPPSGLVARVAVTSKIIGEVAGIPVRKAEYGEIENLPDPMPDTYYIVSTVVLIALKEKGIHRSDVISPDTNLDSAVRDSEGRIVGVRFFQIL
jgi:hypothetical protein